jgi:hypothetical protein
LTTKASHLLTCYSSAFTVFAASVPVIFGLDDIFSVSEIEGVECAFQVPLEAKDFFQANENENAAKASKRKTRDDLDLLTSQHGSAPDGSGPSTAISTAPGQMGIRQAFNNQVKANADAPVCRYFYAEGTPFVKIESPYSKDMLQKVSLFGAGYRPLP